MLEASTTIPQFPSNWFPPLSVEQQMLAELREQTALLRTLVKQAAPLTPETPAVAKTKGKR